jgi:hypothetical protein
VVNLIAAEVDLLSTQSKFPHPVQIHADITIPLADGCWLLVARARLDA